MQGKEIDQKQERNLLSKVFNLFWNLWNHWTRICIRLSTLCINFRLLKVYIWDRHQKYAELNTIQWKVHWLIQVLESFLSKKKILFLFIYSSYFGKIDPCILIITCLIFDQVIGVDHIQVHIIAKWEKNIWFEWACIIHMTNFPLISLLASNGLKSVPARFFVRSA